MKEIKVDTTELQFALALMVCGNVPGLAHVLKYTGANLVRWKHDAYIAYTKHKAELIKHLEACDYFDVCCSRTVHGVTGEQLTEEAGVWVAGFYQWLMEKHDELQQG